LKIFLKTHRAKTNIQIYLQAELMAIKNVFIGKILAYMTQVSDMASGPLVQLCGGVLFIPVEERTRIQCNWEGTTDLTKVNQQASLGERI
jgi:hypothetical protein